MTNKEFAEVNAGKAYLYDGEICKVVGYCKTYGLAVLLQAEIGHWPGKLLDEDDIFTHKVYLKRFKRFVYAYVGDLKTSMGYE